MPKFYGRNKKRIDPRYFLEETTNRDELIENNMSPGQIEHWSSQIYFYIDKNKNRPDSGNRDRPKPFSEHRVIVWKFVQGFSWYPTALLAVIDGLRAPKSRQ